MAVGPARAVRKLASTSYAAVQTVLSRTVCAARCRHFQHSRCTTVCKLTSAPYFCVRQDTVLYHLVLSVPHDVHMFDVVRIIFIFSKDAVLPVCKLTPTSYAVYCSTDTASTASFSVTRLMSMNHQPLTPSCMRRDGKANSILVCKRRWGYSK